MKIYDCFTFFNELDLLEIRLNILNEDVDYFVLVEASKTHSGKEKNLFFEANKERFSGFSKKIIHIIVDDMPEIKNDDRWVLENFQRNAIMRGLLNCENDDIVLISDLDEIPNLKNIEELKRVLNANKSKSDFLYNFYAKIRNYFNNLKINNIFIKLTKKIINHFFIKSSKLIMFKQKIFYYYLNGFQHDHWFGTRAVLFNDLIWLHNSSPQQVRLSMANNVIKDGGWHFSYLFNTEGIVNKIKSFAHSEFDQVKYTNINHIKKSIIDGKNLFGGGEFDM